MDPTRAGTEGAYHGDEGGPESGVEADVPTGSLFEVPEEMALGVSKL